MNKFLVLFILVLMSCSVSPKATPTLAPQSATAGGLPIGTYLTSGKKFLVRMDPPQLEPNADNTVVFTVVTEKLQPVYEEGYEVQSEYLMPKMEMELPPATPEVQGPSRVAFTYEIAHGGLWHVRLLVKKDGKPVDELLLSFELPL